MEKEQQSFHSSNFYSPKLPFLSLETDGQKPVALSNHRTGNQTSKKKHCNETISRIRRRADLHASVRFPRGNASKTGRRYRTGALRNRWIISMNGQDRTIRRRVLSPCSPAWRL